jgi:hypothetical protein
VPPGILTVFVETSTRRENAAQDHAQALSESVHFCRSGHMCFSNDISIACCNSLGDAWIRALNELLGADMANATCLGSLVKQILVAIQVYEDNKIFQNSVVGY